MKPSKELDLPKWPAFTVVGDKVTKEQAAEILLRTNSWWLMTNDNAWLQQVCDLFNIKVDGRLADDKDVDAFYKGIHGLDLEYLSNDRIMSSWIGGPKGWCDWEGNIFCNNYNVGKWPSVSAIESEWKQITKAFPYLKLKSQLWDGETSEDGTKPIIQFNIENGEVEIISPTESIVPPIFSLENVLGASWHSPYRERGCTFEHLEWALDTVRQKINE